jgi:adenylate cyclase
VVEILNEYFERMVDVIFRNRGTLDKFIADGLMVFFGAPVEDPQQEEHAVRTAIEMQQALRELDEKWSADARPTLRIGIGIRSGAAIVGNIGASRRMEYTAIGDTVNLASRLETATREHEADILISESTHASVAGMFGTRSIGPIRVKGRSEPVVAYGVEWEAGNPADV